MHAASNDVRVERSCFFFFFFLTSRSAVDGGMEGCGEEKEEVGMYVRTMASFTLFLSPLSPSGKERLDWRLGRSDRGCSERCQTVQALARDFRLGLAGGGWDSAVE